MNKAVAPMAPPVLDDPEPVRAPARLSSIPDNSRLKSIISRMGSDMLVKKIIARNIELAGTCGALSRASVLLMMKRYTVSAADIIKEMLLLTQRAESNSLNGSERADLAVALIRLQAHLLRTTSCMGMELACESSGRIDFAMSGFDHIDVAETDAIDEVRSDGVWCDISGNCLFLALEAAEPLGPGGAEALEQGADFDDDEASEKNRFPVSVRCPQRSLCSSDSLNACLNSTSSVIEELRRFARYETLFGDEAGFAVDSRALPSPGMVETPIGRMERVAPADWRLVSVRNNVGVFFQQLDYFFKERLQPAIQIKPS